MPTLKKPRIPVVDGEAAERRASPVSSKLDRFVGRSAALADALAMLEAVADRGVPVLLVGERGTGKSLAARFLHDAGHRAERPFLTFRCDASPEARSGGRPNTMPEGLPDAVLEALLLESATVGGTLFLEDVEALAPELQAVLYQVVTGKRLEAVGDARTVPIDLRVVAANRRPLAEAAAAGRFRADLASAFSATTIAMPPLRERIEDLPPLVHHFLDRARIERGARAARFADAALERLMDHDWPGNVGELEALTERLALLARAEEIAVDDLPEAIRIEPALRTWAPRVPATGIDFNGVVERFENDLIVQALARTHWNKNRAARLLGLNRTTLVEKIKKRGLKPPASLR